MNTTLPSWSGLSRPSTSSFIAGGVQGVDARHKGEHDGFWNNLVFMGSGLGPEGPPRNDGELGVPPKKKGKADALPLIVRFLPLHRHTSSESVRLICKAGRLFLPRPGPQRFDPQSAPSAGRISRL